MKQKLGLIPAILAAIALGCTSVPVSRTDNGSPTGVSEQAPAIAQDGIQALTSSTDLTRKRYGVSIDLRTKTATSLSSPETERSIQSDDIGFDVSVSGLDDTDDDGLVDQVRYKVEAQGQSKEYKIGLSPEDVKLANADQSAIAALNSGRAEVPQDVVDHVTRQLQERKDLRSIQSQRSVQLTPLALACIWASASTNAGLVFGCLMAGGLWWACLVGTLGLHTAIAVLRCLVL